jgi:hypothetical protein
MTKTPESLAHAALADDPDALQAKPLTAFEDGSAAMACVGFDHDGATWITNLHFLLCLGAANAFPDEYKRPCPDSFPAMLAAVPARSYAPRVLPDEGLVVIGPARVNRLYYEACSVQHAANPVAVTWRSSGPREPVYGLVGGKVFAVVMPVAPGT